MTARTLFALVWGEMAHQVKHGKPPFGEWLSNLTLGYEPDEPEHGTSSLIQDREGQWFRLTIEPVSPPPKGRTPWQRWKTRQETNA